MKINKYILPVIILLFLFSCQKQPDCSSSYTKNTVVNLAKDIIVSEIAFMNYYELDMENPKKILFLLMTAKETKNKIASEIKNGTEIETEFTEIIRTADSIYLGLKPELINIRTSSKQIEIKKCSCEANLRLSENEDIELNYTVQIIDSGEFFIDVKVKKNEE